MATVINGSKGMERNKEQLEILCGILPYKLYCELNLKSLLTKRSEEIRCRKGRKSFVTSDGKNIMLEHVLTDEETEYMTDRIFGRSLYAHKDTLLDGFVTLRGGIRVGICGRATTENGRIIGIYDISGMNIRLPSYNLNIGERICGLLRNGIDNGVLIYSKPGVGKTTLLRSVASKMSVGENAKRVCVIDTRGEIGASLNGKENSLDILTGYPREKGIEIATRTLSAELIVCDEVGDPRECEAILAAQNSGIPLVASAHGEDIDSLLRRRGIKALHDGRVFEYYVGIKRLGGRFEFDYDITDWEAANALV